MPDKGMVERMNRTIKEATVKRYYYETHDQLRMPLTDFVAAYNFARRLKTLRGLTPYEAICKAWTEEPERFISNPRHQSLGQTSKRLVVSTAGRFPTLAVSIHEVGAFYIILLIAADIRDAAKRDRIPVRGPEDVAARVVTGISGVQSGKPDPFCCAGRGHCIWQPHDRFHHGCTITVVSCAWLDIDTQSYDI